MPDLLRNRSLWLHQFDQTGERTIEGLAATALNYAQSRIILVKAMDGIEFLSQYDTAPEAISSVAKMQETIARGAAVGCTVIPWVNPTSWSNAPEHALLGPALVVDAEPYRGFFEDGQGNLAADFGRYIAGLRAGGVTEIYVSMDPRPAAMQALGVANWARSVDGLLPQLYWTDFQTAPDSPLMVSLVQSLVGLGVPVVPVLPGNGSTGDMAKFWAITGGRFVGAGIWKLGTTDGPHLQEFGAIPVIGDSPTPDPPNPPNPTPKPDVASALARLRSVKADITAAITDLTVPEPAPPAAAWVKPLASYTISQPYGPTDEPAEPVINGQHFHQGIDLAAPLGTPMVSACDGHVTATADDGSAHLGKSIRIASASDASIVAIYGHCSWVGVGIGQDIKAGDGIGKVGSTGNSTGPHLHFQIERNGIPIDPTTIIAL